MRRLLVVACVGSTALASGVAFPHAAGAQGVKVDVDIRCQANNGVQVNLAPWRAKLSQNDTIAWVLHEDAGISLLTITPKQPGAWPFAEFKNTGKHGDAPKAKRMRPTTPKNQPFSYSVTAACPRSDGTTSLVIIDPDIIIIQ